jgi:hypothetical protein
MRMDFRFGKRVPRLDGHNGHAGLAHNRRLVRRPATGRSSRNRERARISSMFNGLVPPDYRTLRPVSLATISGFCRVSSGWPWADLPLRGGGAAVLAPPHFVIPVWRVMRARFTLSAGQNHAGRRRRVACRRQPPDASWTRQFPTPLEMLAWRLLQAKARSPRSAC